MRVKIEFDTKAIGKLSSKIKIAGEQTIEALHTDVIATQVMPFDTGDMQNNETFVLVESEGDTTVCRLVTGSPQSRRLYYHPEYNFQTVNNPNAGGEWLKPWIDGDKKDFVKNVFAKIYSKEAGT